MVGMAAVRRGMLTGVGATALVLAGEALSPLPAPTAGPGPGTVREASQASGAVGETSRSPEPAMAAEPQGGRDPFVRPTASDYPRPVAERPSGLPGLAVDEVILRGLVTGRGGRLAVVEGPDGSVWVARPGDRLRDGAVQEIAGDEVLFLRDPVESVPFSERVVGKRLRDRESAR